MDKSGYISVKELGQAFAACNHTVPGFKLREIVEKIDKDKNGKVSFGEFQELYQQTTSKGVFGEWKGSVTKKEGIDILGGMAFILRLGILFALCGRQKIANCIKNSVTTAIQFQVFKIKQNITSKI